VGPFLHFQGKTSGLGVVTQAELSPGLSGRFAQAFSLCRRSFLFGAVNVVWMVFHAYRLLFE
jgi:hypothetical protein